jgi:murein DD-endopeptidase MepM/ murein hydrolase activator NlpD
MRWAIAIGSLSSEIVLRQPWALAQAPIPPESLCPTPALERIQTYRVEAGDTLEGVAARYNLLAVTLLVMNPHMEGQALAPGMLLRIPPFNGIEVEVTPGQTWEELATTYRVRADVLFEVNGCPNQVPERIFVPGVSWLLEGGTAATTDPPANSDPLTQYPLNQPGSIVANFGWQTDPDANRLIFSSGITVSAPPNTQVLATGNGTVAYVGEQDTLGTLVVINHAQGLQTRYARILNPTVRLGDQVRAGQAIASAAPAEAETTALYFEVRLNSAIGWVAKDPGDYIPELAVR